MHRVFLVGAPRSGTTLVQSLLAAHPSVASFPETHFYPRVVHDGWLAQRGIVRPASRRVLLDVLATLNREDLEGLVPRFPLTVRSLTGAYTEVLDTVARERGAAAWVEKTPKHLERIPWIEATVPDAVFVHVLRNGPDAVASLRSVTRRHPDAWGGERSLDRCIRRWKRSVDVHLRHEADPRHLLVRYEDVAAHPDREQARLLRFVGVDPDAARNRRDAAAGVVEEDEPWKAGVFDEVEDRNGRRFHRELTPEERRYVLDALAEEPYRRFAEEPPEPEPTTSR